MFPPTRTESITEWLQGLLHSLARAGLSFDDDIVLEEPENVEAKVEIRLTAPIPKDGWPHLRNYILNYSLSAGWQVTGLRHAKGLLVFAASRA
jgi:hypothetical protein